MEAMTEKCAACGNEIDPAVCWCGDSMGVNLHDGHTPIPMGCDCGRAKPEVGE